MTEAPTTRLSLLVRLRDPGDAVAWSEFVRLYAPSSTATAAAEGSRTPMPPTSPRTCSPRSAPASVGSRTSPAADRSGPGCSRSRTIASSSVFLAIAPDGRQIATGDSDDDPTVRLWDAKTGAPDKVLRGHAGGIISLAFSPDGSRLASGSMDMTIRIWERATGATLHTLKGHAIAIKSLAFSADGQRLFSVGGWEALRIWDVASAAAGPVLASKSVTAVAAHPRDATIAVADMTEIQVRDRTTGAIRASLPFGMAWSVAVSPDGRWLAAGNDDGTTQLWEYASGEPKSALQGPWATTLGLAFSHDSRTLAAGGRDGTIRLWDVSAARQTRVILPLPGERAATIGPRGDVQTSGPPAEDELVYLIQERKEGPVGGLSPREFRDRFGPHLPRP